MSHCQAKGHSLLSWLHLEPDLASLMPIDDNEVIFIHLGQAEAGEFYSNANTFFTEEEDIYKEMLYEEYYDLKGGIQVCSFSVHTSHSSCISQTLISNFIRHNM